MFVLFILIPKPLEEEELIQPNNESAPTVTVLETPNKGNGFIWVIHTIIDGFEGTGRHANKRAATMLAIKEAKDLKLIITTDRAIGQAPQPDGQDGGKAPRVLTEAEMRQLVRLRSRRGRRTEELVFQAFSVDYEDAPLWFVEVRRPSRQQDMQEKIDVIVATNDPAEIYLQIKSSVQGLRTFLESDPPDNVIGVVIHPSDSHARIRSKIFGAVWKRRFKLGLARRDRPAPRRPRVKILSVAPPPKHVPKRLLRSKGLA